MANHGKQGKTATQRARHYAKRSRAARLERRCDERLEDMRRDLALREAVKAAAAEVAALGTQVSEKAA